MGELKHLKKAFKYLSGGQYHGKANIGLLQGRTIICSISCYRDDLPLFQHSAVDDT